MTTNDHMARVRKLAEQSRQWEAQDACPINEQVCRCPTCGVATQLIRGRLVARGWSQEDAKRVVTTPPSDASYPYLASVRVDGRETYRVLKDLAEVLDGDILDDIETALGKRRETPSC